MIQGNFCGSEGPEPVGLSSGQFRLVVEPFDDAAGDRAPSAEPVEEQLAVGPQHPGYFLHRLESRAQGSSAPAVQKAAGPGRGYILPEGLEVLLEQVAADRSEIVAKQVRQSGV